MTVFDDLTDLVDAGEPAALLTVVAKEGSAPRDVGTRMVVTREDAHGTIGGGTVEGLAVEDARAVLAGDADPGIRSYELHPDGNTGMVCGGRMDVFVDRVRGSARLHVAGGGHIGRELAALADRVGYEVVVVDDREEYADPDAFPGGVDVRRGDYGAVLRELPTGPDTAVAVATRSGTFDGRAVAAAVDGGAGYVGLVASETKADRVVDGLVEDGYSRAELARVRSPVGLDLGGGGPADIALAVLAEVHAVRHDASAAPAVRERIAVDDLAVVRGGGDLGSGVVYRLHQAGYPVVVTEVAEPTVVRRGVAFGTAMYEGAVTVEGVTGRRADTVDDAVAVLRSGDVPVLADPDGSALPAPSARSSAGGVAAKSS